MNTLYLLVRSGLSPIERKEGEQKRAKLVHPIETRNRAKNIDSTENHKLIGQGLLYEMALSDISLCFSQCIKTKSI